MKKIALISMYEGDPAPGFFALEALAKAKGHLVATIDVRLGEPLPDLQDFDVLLSSGGPGDPTDLGTWGEAYVALIDRIMTHNAERPDQPKKVFLVCHSFQIMSYVWGLGSISKRDAALWGVHPQLTDPIELIKPVFPSEDFYALESRFYQVMPTADCNDVCKAKHLAITARDEKGALTAWQTLDGHIAATQFHPEATKDMVEKLLDNPPVGMGYTMNNCDKAMWDMTRERLELLPRMNDLLADFIVDPV